jgi:hypothetical protein
MLPDLMSLHSERQADSERRFRRFLLSAPGKQWLDGLFSTYLPLDGVDDLQNDLQTLESKIRGLPDSVRHMPNGTYDARGYIGVDVLTTSHENKLNAIAESLAEVRLLRANPPADLPARLEAIRRRVDAVGESQTIVAGRRFVHPKDHAMSEPV